MRFPNPGKRRWLFSSALGLLLLASSHAGAQSLPQPRTPVIVDTDIGADIDDAFALALVLRSRNLDLKAVTTVLTDTQARARIAAKMLSLAGQGTVPVAAGTSSAGPAFAQARWAADFASPPLVQEPAVELLHHVLVDGDGRVVIIAIGPLTNVAALLRQHPEDRRSIKQIVLMGGSIAHGYYPNSGPTAESNIATDIAAARTVFSSGVPLLVAPLDVTAALQIKQPELDRLFAQHTPLTNALHDLYALWDQPTPTLHDPMAVALLVHPGVSQTKPLHIDITDKGMTVVQPGAEPNAVVAVHTDPAAFLRYYESVFTGP